MSKEAAVRALEAAADQAAKSAEEYRRKADNLHRQADEMEAIAIAAEDEASSCRLGAIALNNLGNDKTCPSECAARHPGREHEWINTPTPRT